VDGMEALTASRHGSIEQLSVVIVGGGQRAASLLRMLHDAGNVRVASVCAPGSALPSARMALDLGVAVTSDLGSVCRLAGIDLIIDMSEDDRVHSLLLARKPDATELIGAKGSWLVWDLLVARKRGQEQERLVAELQDAYEKIRSHERRLQASKEALERANDELERRLAEIFFTHEFFKALTSFTSVDDVCSLIVDGCNGILGAEISCVYLIERSDWTLRLRACQGRPEDAFSAVVPVAETVLGRAFRDGTIQQNEVGADHASAAWCVHTGDIRSQAAVPLRAGEDVFGVMIMASSTGRELSVAEVERLQVIGNQSSLSLQNALLHGELERLSVTDRLTELYNHGYFQQRLEEEINRAERFGHRLSLIMLDIDDFKEFNDTYGHPRGDEVLKAVSAVIRDNLRDIDVAARYGGEEFVVVLPETDAVGALAVGERIRDEVDVRGVTTHQGEQVGRTVSVGVATFPVDAHSPARLIEAADAAMYRAKRAGKDRVEAADRP